MVTNGNNEPNGNGSKKRELTAQKLIKALHESNGLMTFAAKRAGVGYATVKRYVAEFPSVAQAVVDAKEGMLDFAEGKLMEKIKAGDNTAIIFYLKTQGKARGYIERQEFANPAGESFKVEHDAKGKLISMFDSLAARRRETQEVKQADSEGS